jgi:hypothetical protein
MQKSQGAIALSLPAPSPSLDLVVLDDEALSQVVGSVAFGPGGTWSDLCAGPGNSW